MPYARVLSVLCACQMHAKSPQIRSKRRSLRPPQCVFLTGIPLSIPGRLSTLIIRSYQGENTGSHPNSEVKHPWACSVLRWGTTRESQVTNVFACESHYTLYPFDTGRLQDPILLLRRSVVQSGG